jgi:hypothetical protein
MKTHPTIACCGIDCGFCPRYHTTGSSKCPGCGGPNFSQKHPSCGILNCANKKQNFETCAECKTFPCEKIIHWDAHDSFVSHKISLVNLKQIRSDSLNEFLEKQMKKITILNEFLSNYDNGRNKSLYCLAVTLFSIDKLNQVVDLVQKQIIQEKIEKSDVDNKAKILKSLLNQIATQENIILKLRK